MPGDRPRSAAYRSFLTCDDPKGVVECKRVRKSKTGYETNVCLSKKEREEVVSKGSGDELNCSCSVQLMEVSRGAQKLTRVLDSWSKGIGSERKSKDVAKDLLKGALDLQESLERLERLQEVMTKSNKPKEGNGKANRGIERTKSERIVGDRKYKLELRKARHSVDGVSWDCYDELREAIQESFARQNLSQPVERASFGSRQLDLSPDLPSTSSSQSSFEKACFDRRQLSSSPDHPSTSSSQSQEFSSFHSSLPMAQQLKPMGTSLIAKLMGLEDISQFTSHKQLEKDQPPNQKRPIFEFDLLKAKKAPFVVEKVDTQQKTSQESIGACEPIVVMKPFYVPDRNAERFYSRTHPFEGNGFDSKEMCTKWKRKELRGGSKHHGEAVASPNESINPRKPRLEKKEVIEKRVDKIQRASPNMRKEETKGVKFMEASKRHDLEKMAPVKLTKQEVLSYISLNQVMWQKTTALDHTPPYHKTSNRTVRSSSAAIIENLRVKKAHTHLKPEKEIEESETQTEVSENLHFEEVSDMDDRSTDESISCISNADDQYCVSPRSNPECNTTKNMLLSSSPFLARAKELFGTCAWKPIALKPDYSHDEMPETAKLLLDCASELLENKNLQIIDRLPIRSQACISLDKLVAEICEGIDTLRSYKDLADTLCVDTSSALIERDLWCNGAVRGACDLGWRKGFTCNEVELVVADMEKLLLRGILDDALEDFAG